MAQEVQAQGSVLSVLLVDSKFGALGVDGAAEAVAQRPLSVLAGTLLIRLLKYVYYILNITLRYLNVILVL